MTPPTFDSFAAAARADGFPDVLERAWQPDTVLDTHTHDFAVRALVTQGELWLTHSGRTQHLKTGDAFALEARVPHAERYGPAGATYWVARRPA